MRRFLSKAFLLAPLLLIASCVTMPPEILSGQAKQDCWGASDPRKGIEGCDLLLKYRSYDGTHLHTALDRQAVRVLKFEFLLALKDYPAAIQEADYALEEIAFWVKWHYLPMDAEDKHPVDYLGRPLDYLWRLRHGEAQLLAGQKDAALADFDAAVALLPDMAYGYFLRGLLHTHMGHVEAALADFDHFIEIDKAEDGGVTRLQQLMIEHGYHRMVKDGVDDAEFRSTLRHFVQRGAPKPTQPATPKPTTDAAAQETPATLVDDVFDDKRRFTPSYLMDEQFSIVEGDRAAPHTLLFIHNADGLFMDYRVLEEQSFYGLVDAGKLRVRHYLIYSRSRSSLYGNLALICAGPSAYRALSAELRSESGRAALKALAGAEDTSRFRAYLQGLYEGNGVSNERLDSCVFNRRFAEAYLQSFLSAAGRASEGHANLYFSWPTFVYDNKVVKLDRINDLMRFLSSE